MCEVTRLLGVIGYPIGHSLSPLMHNTAIRHLSLNQVYLPFEVHPDGLGTAVAGLKALGARGINVTIPHKEAVIQYVDELSEEARLVGAVNTLLFEEHRTFGHNTDGKGFLAALEEEGIDSPVGKVAVVLGAGGAARAICVQLLLANAGRLVIANRTYARAVALARSLSETISGAQVDTVELTPLALRDAVCSAQLVINTTSVGMGGSGSPPLPWELIRPDHLVCDIVYRPLKTPLLRQAEARGCRTVGGLGMLIHQGNLSFNLWTGQEFPLSLVRNTLLCRLKDEG